jgi:hypothetical protein
MKITLLTAMLLMSAQTAIATTDKFEAIQTSVELGLPTVDYGYGELETEFISFAAKPSIKLIEKPTSDFVTVYHYNTQVKFEDEFGETGTMVCTAYISYDLEKFSAKKADCELDAWDDEGLIDEF